MTSLELAKAFELSYNENIESQKEQIKQDFSNKLTQIKNNIPSLIDSYDDDDDFYIRVSVVVHFICLKAVAEWAYTYFEEMDNVVVNSILSGYSYIEEADITKIDLKIYV